MANYCGTCRTNYFKVKNEKAFLNFMNNVVGDDFYIFDKEDKDGNKSFGFGCYGEIYGIATKVGDENEVEYDYDLFLENLQEHIADNDAIIIMEAGHEKLRYVKGSVLVITSAKIMYKDTDELAIELARKALKNENYTTQLYY